MLTFGRKMERRTSVRVDAPVVVEPLVAVTVLVMAPAEKLSSILVPKLKTWDGPLAAPDGMAPFQRRLLIVGL